MDYPQADFTVAYNASQTPPSVVFQNWSTGVEIAFLYATAFGTVAVGDLPSLLFTTELVDMPLEPGDTVVLHTDTGAYFKVGNAVTGASGLTFDYQQLQ